MRIEALGDAWTPAEVAALDADVEWVHVAPLARSDFPAETLAALAAGGRQVSFDGQGLVRVPRVGPLALDADFDPASLTPLRVLKLAEEEATVVAAGRFDADAAARLGVPEILVTRGSAGATVYVQGREEGTTSAVSVPDVHTTGAGDVFMVAYVGGHSEGAAPPDAAAHASDAVARMLEARKARSS
jgi:sugar/nucleoside kinase (ribokinase family)